MYEYESIEKAKAGDVVERIKQGPSNEPYDQIGYLAVVGKDYPESEGCRPSLDPNWWKLVKTLPGSEAKVGDTVIFTKDSRFESIKQTIGQLGVGELSNGMWLYHIDKHEPIVHYCGTQLNEFVVLCKAEPISTEKRNLAFYKHSGKPWTDEECENIVRYIGATTQVKNKDWGNPCPTRRYMFDDGSELFYMANWYDQEEESNFKNCKQVAYEDVFETPHAEENTAIPRVAIVTTDVSGHPVGSRIVPTDASNYNWKLADGSKSSTYCHSIGSSCEWEDTLTTHTDTVTFIPLDEISPATPCSLPTLNPIPEEEAMNKDNITIAMTADEYAKYQKSNKPTKPKSQLETASKWITIWYGVNGNVDCQTTESPKKAKKALQHPSKLGFTFRSYLITESATTDIPVVNVAI